MKGIFQMKHYYRVKIEKEILGEENSKETYGIEAVSMDGASLRAVGGLFSRLEEAERFVALCNRGELSLLHIDDAVADLRYEQATASAASLLAE